MITTTPSKKIQNNDQDKRAHLRQEKDDKLTAALSNIHQRQKEQLAENEAKSKGFFYIDLHDFPISNKALQLLEREFCEKEKVVSFYFQNEQIRLGTPDPDNPSVKTRAEELQKKYRAEVVIYYISKSSLAKAFERYDTIPRITKEHDSGFELTSEALKEQQKKITSIQKMNEAIAEAPITDVLAVIIGAAIKSNASDIHIEAESDNIKIRLRIDGVLHDIGKLPTEAWGRISSRIKLLANLKINITNKPQDGRFTIYIDDDKIEVRTSTVPTAHGESAVMRLLRFSLDSLKFDKLGLTGYTFDALKRETRKPNGMIVSTGPTGSGKTTTLYAILHKLNKPGTKILTLEDPIEYKLKGINQTQIDIGAGLDFATGLRSLLRQDPDIIMVGEIRDLETADTSINAALTGHLMLSTLHTNSAAGAIPRFLAMGSKQFLLAPSINAIVGQRLVRLLCTTCKKPHKTEAVYLKKVNEALAELQQRDDLGIQFDLSKPDELKFMEAEGCEQCNGLGYKGRIGIFEILTMNKELEQIILAGNVSEYDIQDAAKKHGMVTMLQDGILKALQGITSLNEVFRQTE